MTGRARVAPYAIDPAGVSSEGGSFVLDGVMPGRLQVQARVPGHSPVDSAVLVLDDGEHQSGILLDIGEPSQPLVAFTGVFGRVLDERDQAVGDASSGCARRAAPSGSAAPTNRGPSSGSHRRKATCAV